MSKHLNFRRLAFAVTLAALVLGAFVLVQHASTPKAARSLLTDDPCAAPCWYGLSPGLSTEADVRSRLRELSFIDASRLQESESDGIISIKLTWLTPGLATSIWGTGHGAVTIDHGILDSIEFEPDSIVTVGDVFAKYGPPEKVLFRPNTLTERILYWAYLFYPAHGLMFNIEFAPRDTRALDPSPSRSINPDTNLRYVTYQRVMSLDELKRYYASTGAGRIIDEWQDWK